MDHVLGERLVGLALGDAQEIVPDLSLGIGTGQRVGGGVMGAADIAGMSGIAAAVEFGCCFEDEDRGAFVARADRGA